MGLKRVLAFFCVMMLVGGCAHVRELDSRTYRFDEHALELARAKYRAGDPATVAVVKDAIANADKAMTGGPWSVTYKKKSIPNVDKHDYVSIAAYYWPDPKNPNGPWIQRDGERNPEFANYDALPLMQLTDHVDALVLAGYLTGEQKYFDRAAYLIRVWFLNPETRMNPNLDHSQLMFGTNDGAHQGVIEARRFMDMIDATILMRGTSAWSEQDDAAFREWIKQFLAWMYRGKIAIEEGQQPNNHGTWYDVQVVTYSLYTGDIAGARKILEAAKKHRIADAIAKDGTEPEEIKRTKSFWYEEFNLNALTQLADLGRRRGVGVDLWNYSTLDGRSIRLATDWLLPYAVGEKPWTVKNIEPISAKEFGVVLRRAESAWNTDRYEWAMPKLIGKENPSDDSKEHPLRTPDTVWLMYPPPEIGK